jgi:hypothetical protein
VEGLVEMGSVVGGGTALVTPVPNLPEFKICNAGGACEKESDGAGRKINTFFTCGVGGPEVPLVVV